MTPQPDHGEHSYKGSGRLAGKAAIITGSDSGIGRAVAIAFAREGADVLISYYEEDDDAKETQHWVEQAGRRAILMPGDVADETYCQSLVDRAVREFGKLDILVNNAAMQRTHKSIDEISSEEWDCTFRTNIYSMFYLSKAALRHMQPGAAIVNYHLDQRQEPVGQLAGLCHDEGGDRQLHGWTCPVGGGKGRAGELRRTRTDLDTADPVDDAGGAGRELWQEYTVGACRAAGGAGSGVCAAGVGRSQLHDGRLAAGNRRQADVIGTVGVS
jgi:hypothetical protein